VERRFLGAAALAGKKRTSWGVVVVGSWGLLLKPGVLELDPLAICWDAAGLEERVSSNLGETGSAAVT
jgi:hypothetical protein